MIEYKQMEIDGKFYPVTERNGYLYVIETKLDLLLFVDRRDDIQSALDCGEIYCQDCQDHAPTHRGALINLAPHVLESEYILWKCEVCSEVL